MKKNKRGKKTKGKQKEIKGHNASPLGDHSPMAWMGKQTTTYRDETTKLQTYGWTASYRDVRTHQRGGKKIQQKKGKKNKREEK